MSKGGGAAGCCEVEVEGARQREGVQEGAKEGGQGRRAGQWQLPSEGPLWWEEFTAQAPYFPFPGNGFPSIITPKASADFGYTHVSSQGHREEQGTGPCVRSCAEERQGGADRGRGHLRGIDTFPARGLGARGLPGLSLEPCHLNIKGQVNP